MLFKTIAATAVAVAIAGPALAQVEGPEVSWRIATYGTQRAATTSLHTIADYVAEHTDGRFTITIGYGTLGEPREFLDLLEIGSIDGATINASYNPERLPGYTVLDLPFLPLGNADVQQQVHEAVHEHPAIQEEFARWNAFPFMSSLIPQYELLGTGEPPETIEQLDGLRIRALGGVGDALGLLGVTPTPVPAPEAYLALERGLVDAIAFPFYAHVSFRIYEVGDWLTTNMSLGTVGSPLVLNINSWEALPEQYQELLYEARTEAYEDQKAAFETGDAEALQTMTDAGLHLITYSDEELQRFREIGARPIWDLWVESNADVAPAQELLDLVLTTAEEAATN